MMNYTVVFAYLETVDGSTQARLRIEQVEAVSSSAAIAAVAGRCPATPQDAIAFVATGVNEIDWISDPK